MVEITLRSKLILSLVKKHKYITVLLYFLQILVERLSQEELEVCKSINSNAMQVYLNIDDSIGHCTIIETCGQDPGPHISRIANRYQYFLQCLAFQAVWYKLFHLITIS